MKRPEPIQINIPKPCSEDWSKMTAIEQGRYCDSCKKCVVDFTGFTDKAIYEYFLQHKGEHICGRVLSSQVNRAISLPPQPHSKLYRYFTGLGLTLLFTQMPVEHVNAKAPYAYTIALDNTDSKKSGDSNIKIYGRVLDDHKGPVAGAIINLVNGTQQIGGTVTNEYGDFEIVIPKEQLTDSVLYQKVSYIGCRPNIIKLSELNYNRYQEIKLGYDIKGGMEFIEVIQPKVPLIDLFEPSKTVITSEEIEKMAR